MKIKLILLIATLITIHPQNSFAVDNQVGSVEKEYQHKLICEGTAGSENYQLTVEWTHEVTPVADGRAPMVHSEFQYELQNLTQNTTAQDSYEDFFNEYNSISQSAGQLQFSGSFNMWKRLGYINKTTDINLAVVDGVYTLSSLKNTYLETFSNPKDWCNPPTRLCGSEPISKDPEPQVTLVQFENSTCQQVQ